MPIAAFVFGCFVGSVIGWVTCALMVHAGRESDAMEAEYRASLQRADDGTATRLED